MYIWKRSGRKESSEDRNDSALVDKEERRNESLEGREE
jgi:hypothetical protein